MDKIEIDKAVKKEVLRLKRIYKNIDKNEKALVEGLINQAARLRVSLNNLWDDICTNGNTELFSQSEKTEPYERERPAARLFNVRVKNYQSIIKLLEEWPPDVSASESSEALMKFAMKYKK